MAISEQEKKGYGCGSVCVHQDCGQREREYLPPINPYLCTTPTQKTPWCINCGNFKNISSDRARSLGYYTNLITNMNKKLRLNGYSLSQCQIRLIIKDLEQDLEFQDTYHMTYTAQMERLKKIIRKYIPDINL